jgi:hypothetical protein
MTDVAISGQGIHERRTFRHRRESVSFTDVVRARYRDDDERFRSRLERFEDENGAVSEVWWSEEFSAAVAVTVKRRPRLLRLLGLYETLTLHRKTEELAREAPDFGMLLLQVDRQAIRVSNVLAGMSQRMAMSNLYALTRDVVSYLESMRLLRRPSQEVKRDDLQVPEEQVALKSYRRELAKIETYAGQAAARQAQIVYLKGMMRGLAMLLLLAPALAGLFLLTDVPGVDETLFIACLISGSLGALMSVLMRMNSGKFKVNHEIGREYLSNLGAARPFIGAIFALLLYFAFQGQLLDQIRLPDTPEGEFAFFMVSGFLIGFSERFAKELLAVSEQAVGIGQDPPPGLPAPSN